MRLVTTAGVTVLGLTAMSGMAQADTGGLKLPVDLTGPLAKTGPLGKTVDGVVKQATSGPRRSAGPGLRVNLPVDLRLGAPARKPGRPSAPAVHAGVKASVKVAPLSVRADVSLRLCAQPPRECVPNPPSPIPPTPPAPPVPPTPPPTPPVGMPLTPRQPAEAAPATGSLPAIGDDLPFTGGPIGALTLLGATAVLSGAAGIAASRRKPAGDA
ncbi:hypothetical protein [Actinoallomurus bryophytorum]|uniref:hypothetical protein n=1 Tax=Actinoallomurus bryophytorum TaxID=1490222 RepID=UPI001151E9B6|nr:hypothetical protein [Actinoallomurus bryophytorum]